MAVLGTFTMQPADEWDYDLDYADWLPESDGISEFAEPTVTVAPDGLDVISVTRDYDNKRVKVWIGGGSDGEDYKVEVTMTSSEGRVRQDEFIISVREF